MKKIATKSFLWSVVIIEVIVLIIVFILYTASNQKTLNFLATKVTSDLNISYDRIYGSLLDSISIHNVKYNDKKIADEITIAWNLKSLLSSTILINKVKLDNLNVYTTKELIDSFSNKNSSDKKANKTLNIPNIEISDFDLTLLPYKNKFIAIDKLDIKAKTLKSKQNIISIKEYILNTKNDIADIYSKGYLKNSILNISTLDLNNINMMKIQKLLSDIKDQNSSNKTTFEPFSKLNIKKLTLNTLPFEIKNQNIYKLDIRANNLNGDIKSLLFNSNTISLDLKTDIALLQTTGIIQKNTFISNLSINLDPNYFKDKAKDIDFKNFNPINIKLYANKDSIDANVSLKSKNVFKGRFARCNNSINFFNSRVHFDLKTKKLDAYSDANVSTRYASSLILKDHLTYTKSLKYGGSIDISGLKHFPDYSLPLFKNAKILYNANEENLTANLNTDKLHLLYKMYSYKKADFFLDSKELNISKYFPLIPKELHKLKARVDANMKLDFKNAKKLFIDTNISSNAIDLKGKIYFKNGVQADAKATLVKNSILSNIDKNIKLKEIFPSDFKLRYKNKKLNITNQNKNLTTQFLYDLNSTKLNLITNIENNKFQISGDSKKLILNSHVLSLKELQASITKIYDFKPLPLDGEIELNSTIINMRKIDANFKSRWLVYEYKTNNFAFAEKIKLNINTNDENITISDYDLYAYIYGENRHLFAKKPSYIKFKNNEIIIDKLWINDELKTIGKYNLKTNTGNLLSKANKFHYKGKEGDLTLNIDIKTLINKQKSSIVGNINIIDGLITYKYRNMHDIQDPDIIIIQEQEKLDKLKNQKSTKLTVNISINSKKPITYKVPDIEIKLQPDLKFWKEENKDLELLGRVAIINGKYIQTGKEFTILPSELLFGGDIINPYLNIKAKYFSDPYDIDIDISGKVDSPEINFSSSPYLSQSDILSILLFNSTSASLFNENSSTSNKAISFFGNTFAKEIIKKFGIKLDKLVILTNEEGGFGVEVGKKISKKVTVIYINDIVQTIKIKYLHSDHFESDITLSPESSGIDFIYKREH